MELKVKEARSVLKDWVKADGEAIISLDFHTSGRLTLPTLDKSMVLFWIERGQAQLKT